MFPESSDIKKEKYLNLKEIQEKKISDHSLKNHLNSIKNSILKSEEFVYNKTLKYFYKLLLEDAKTSNNGMKNIFISGIGMNDGGHFYELHDKSKDVNQRRKVDKFLIKFLHKKYKKRMFSCDRDFANLAKINYFENNKV